ncbi:hypothetical protein DY000_02052792 [Brassica cretica]|uniref:Uncharacterized protein n=1 Tax=Brassica cretica TaxID=69181 RepID=A0ABQ7AC64_BRACR|nr:hypothetical protein DY000_02052792 [Brassica cretica]
MTLTGSSLARHVALPDHGVGLDGQSCSCLIVGWLVGLSSPTLGVDRPSVMFLFDCWPVDRPLPRTVQGAPFTIGDTTYLDDGIIEEQNLAAINGESSKPSGKMEKIAVGNAEINCSGHVLREIFSEEKARSSFDLNVKPAAEGGWLLRLVSGSLIDLRTQGVEVTHVLDERNGREMRNHEAWRYAARLESRRR